ncbi:hypothetical protein Aperf_G00000089642 [Anoplocephala perfoliata]
MLHVLTKKSKSKSRSQRGEIAQDTRWEGLSAETKSTTPDFRDQRSLRCGKESSVRNLGEDRKFGGSMRTRSSSSRRSCSAVVTFESIKPTQIWQASASPSPPTATVTNGRRTRPKRPADNLALSMIAQTSAENQWLSLSTGDEDDLSDSTDDDDDDLIEENKGRRSDSDRVKRGSGSKSHRMRSSNSSSDSSSSFEMSRSSTKSAHHRRKKQSSRRLRRDNTAFLSGSSSASSDSSSSSSSEGDNEFDICWNLKPAGSLRNTPSIQSTPQLKRAPNHHHQQPLVSQPTGTPQVIPRYPPTHQYKRPQTLNLAGSPFPRPLSSRSSTKEAPFVQTIARAVEDFFPTLEWVEKYKVIVVHRGDLLRIIPYPGTNPDKTSPTTGWFLAQKWCSEHGSGTGPIGFVPRIVCSFVGPESTPRVTHISPRHSRSQDYTMKMSEAGVFMTVAPTELIQANAGGQITVVSTISDVVSEPIAARGLYPSPQLSLHTSSATAAKTSFTSIPAVYEIEDRDSGRGPSSGSEWSSGKGGSLSGATDTNLDEKEQQHSAPQQSSSSHISSSLKWSPTASTFQRRASPDQRSGSNFSCPLPPPPMALLSHVCADALGTKKPVSAAYVMSASDTEAGSSLCSNLGTRNRLYVRTSKSNSEEGKLEVEGGIQKSEGNSEDSPIAEELLGVATGDQEEEEGETSGSPQSTVVVVSSNSDPAHWEPYKTMIQVGQNKLEKFTLV